MPATPAEAPASLLRSLVRLAALCHDLGKLSHAFQKKLLAALAGAIHGEYIRHEALSYFLLRRLCPGNSLAELRRLTELDGAGLAALVATSSPTQLREAFDRALAEDLQELQRLLGLRMPANAAQVENALVRLIALLSLTHHHLPGARDPDRREYTYEGSITGAQHFNDLCAPEFGDCLIFPHGNRYQAGLAESLAPELLGCLDDMAARVAALPPEFDLARFVRLAMLLARPAMVGGDYIGSALKSEAAGALGSVPLANTRSDEEKRPLGAGDAYETHIRRVLHYATGQADLCLGLLGGDDAQFPHLSSAAHHAIAARRMPVGKFAWQNDAFEHIKAHRVPAVPAFCIVTAETGSGKTIASAQIAQALGSGRFTYCLGLRSLTLQTGASYRADLGLDETDLATVIGDRVAKKAFDVFSAEAAAAGSESLAQEAPLLAASHFLRPGWLKALSTGLPGDVAKAFGYKMLSFITTPVVVCTIDQLVGVARMRKVTKALHLLRVFSADLVLDEVDNYSPGELRHIQRLCYFAGLARRHVICLSATMGPVHSETLLGAFRAGVRDSHALTGLPDAVQLLLVSNLARPASHLLLGGVPLADALAQVERFNAATIAAQGRRPGKVRHAVLKTHAKDYAGITTEMLRLHGLNAVEIEGRKVSVGFVRFNEVKSAREFAASLYRVSTLPSDTELAVVCYHSRYSALELSVIDSALVTLTNRKGLPAGQELSTDAIERYVRPLAHAADKPNLLFVVATTSILETGRDHDYDWAISEPNSHRSLIQAGGRVRRHREDNGTSCNFSVILHPERVVGDDGNLNVFSPISVWSYPGPLTPLRRVLSKHDLAPSPMAYDNILQDAKEAMGNTAVPEATNKAQREERMTRDVSAAGILQDDYPDGIRSAIALLPPAKLRNSTALLEQYTLYRFLLAKCAQPRRKPYAEVSGRVVNEEGLILTDWSYLAQFREEDGEQETGEPAYLADETSLRVQPRPMTDSGDAAALARDVVDVRYAHRCLLTLPLLAGVAAGMTPKVLELHGALLQATLLEHGSRGFTPEEQVHLTAYVPTPDKSGHLGRYHPLLGYGSLD